MDGAVVVHDDPADVIVDLARERATDLLALTTHGHGGPRRLMLGRVAAKLLRGSSGDVLALRPKFD